MKLKVFGICLIVTSLCIEQVFSEQGIDNIAKSQYTEDQMLNKEKDQSFNEELEKFDQVLKKHTEKIEQDFKQLMDTFENTELIGKEKVDWSSIKRCERQLDLYGKELRFYNSIRKMLRKMEDTWFKEKSYEKILGRNQIVPSKLGEAFDLIRTKMVRMRQMYENNLLEVEKISQFLKERISTLISQQKNSRVLEEEKVKTEEAEKKEEFVVNRDNNFSAVKEERSEKSREGIVQAQVNKIAIRNKISKLQNYEKNIEIYNKALQRYDVRFNTVKKYGKICFEDNDVKELFGSDQNMISDVTEVYNCTRDTGNEANEAWLKIKDLKEGDKEYSDLLNKLRETVKAFHKSVKILVKQLQNENKSDKKGK